MHAAVGRPIRIVFASDNPSGIVELEKSGNAVERAELAGDGDLRVNSWAGANETGSRVAAAAPVEIRARAESLRDCDDFSERVLAFLKE